MRSMIEQHPESGYAAEMIDLRQVTDIGAFHSVRLTRNGHHDLFWTAVASVARDPDGNGTNREWTKQCLAKSFDLKPTSAPMRDRGLGQRRSKGLRCSNQGAAPQSPSKTNGGSTPANPPLSRKPDR